MSPCYVAEPATVCITHQALVCPLGAVHQGCMAFPPALGSWPHPLDHLWLLSRVSQPLVAFGYGEHPRTPAPSRTFSRVLEPSHITIGQLTPGTDSGLLCPSVSLEGKGIDCWDEALEAHGWPESVPKGGIWLPIL